MPSPHDGMIRVVDPDGLPVRSVSPVRDVWSEDEVAVMAAQVAGHLPGVLSSRFAVDTYRLMKQALEADGFVVRRTNG